MNKGQEQFQGFILERVQENKVEEAKTLLADNFKKQAEGTFTQADVLHFIPKMVAMLKPDKVEEVKAVMKQFASTSSH